MTARNWPLPAPSPPGQHPVEALAVGIDLTAVQRLADIKVICETYLNDDEAREDIALVVEGRPPLHSLMVGEPR